MPIGKTSNIISKWGDLDIMGKTQEFKVKSVTPQMAVFTNDNPYDKISLIFVKLLNSNMNLRFQVQLYDVQGEHLVDGQVLKTESIITSNNTVLIDLDGLYLVKQLIIYNLQPVPLNIKPNNDWFKGISGVVVSSDLTYNISGQDYLAIVKQESQLPAEPLPDFNPITVQARLKEARKIELVGDVIGEQHFDGSGDIQIPTTVTVQVSGGNNEQLDYQTQLNTPSTIVKRDTNGNFQAGTITQTLNGNQQTASKLQTQREIQLTGQVIGSQMFDGSGNITIETVSTVISSDDIQDQTDQNEPLTIVRRDSNGNFQAGTITQTLNGNQQTASKLQTQREIQLAGQVTGSQMFDGSGQVTIAASVPDLTNQTDLATPSTLVKRDTNGGFQASTITQTLNGNQQTASKLQVQRTIQISGYVAGSQSFDGSGDITINVTKEGSDSQSLPLTGGTLTGDLLLQTPAKLQLATPNTSLEQGTNTSLRVNTQYGYLLLGPQDANYQQFQTDKSAYTFDKPIELNTQSIKYINSLIFDWQSKANSTEGHQIVSQDQAGAQADSLRINSLGSVYVNIDSNADSTADVFQVYKDSGTGQLTEQNRLMYVNELGEFYATKVYGQVYNDYAEYRETAEYVEPGYVQISDNGKLRKCNKDMARNIAGVVSDVFGFQIGQTNSQTTPVQVQGRALVYCEDKSKVKQGDQLCQTKDGKVRKMSWLEKVLHPESIVGFVDEIPEYETWGTNNVKVNGRIWVRLR